ncbi:hypothetical protein O4G76_15425 [Limimaricola sp. G21655-S1]|uniref:hypothetical protein n=1 Tax=Limimaricola sp. G21655-S1 TaxID=3014768 RepID=UPI0022AFC615|nr:hypothetical protein [Limimaricola sp. G21655-S1]MCZ4262232.1 hypothetical protein [Limimaricola sp. G21655-S1]
MSTITRKPRRVVTARRVLALGASAAMIGSTAGAASVATDLSDPQGLVHQIEAEGEGAVEIETEGEGAAEAEGERGAIEVEGEGEGAAGAEGEGEGAVEVEGEGSVEAEGDGEGAVEADGEGEGAVEAEGEGEGAVEAEGAMEAEGEADAAGEGESEGGSSALEPALAHARSLLVIDGLLRAAEAQRGSGEDAAELIEEAAELAEHGLEGALAGELYERIEELEAAADDQGFAELHERLAAARAEATAADRLEAISLGLRAAGEHYAEAVTDGAVSDRTEYLEAFGIYEAVKAEADALAASDEAAVAEVGAEVRAQIEEAGAAFGGSAGEDIATPEASLLHAAAARVELSALKLR